MAKVLRARLLSGEATLTRVKGTGRVHVLRNELRVEFSTVMVPRRFLTVPAGFLTDGASVPRGLWWFAPPFGEAYETAAVVHDAVYASHVVDKDTADWLFYRMMLSAGVKRWKAKAMYWAVRVFGGKAWKNGGDYKAVTIELFDRGGGVTNA